MKVLVLSNFYPPHYLGGYELGCRDVVEGLRGLGHQVKVLTSQHGSGAHRDAQADRLLHTSLGWTPRFGWRHVARLASREVVDGRTLRTAITRYAPDLIYVWNVLSLPLSLLAVAEEHGTPVVHFISDEHLTRWASDPWFTLLAAPARNRRRAVVHHAVLLAARLRLMALPRRPRLRHAQFASAYLRQAFAACGLGTERAEVIHWGVDDAWFLQPPRAADQLRVLYAGRLSPEKGVETAVDAFGHLRTWLPESQARLTIVGGSGPPEYAQALRERVASRGLHDRVSFVGKLDRTAIQHVYGANDVFLLPSIWQEPFSIALVEAMARGLVPVATLTGGTGEILQPETNGLAFAAGNAEECARRVCRLIDQPRLREQFGAQAQRTAWEHFRLQAMVKRIERSLAVAATAADAPRRQAWARPAPVAEGRHH